MTAHLSRIRQFYNGFVSLLGYATSAYPSTLSIASTHPYQAAPKAIEAFPALPKSFFARPA